eukprot:TRINITY_DN31006_c0_g1_i3.p1 TRINITY_DN31006_c0_g1~~TRINITY_DN31006_c0_g1_i3.p1  ORF type:complete len:535 (+),score=89.01 TRINITY_DN31006_c0_g1_i3:210-1814(+)
MSVQFSPYSTLGLDQAANNDQVRLAFKRCALQAHPDKGGSKEAFHAVMAAFELLSDPVRRALYDTGTHGTPLPSKNSTGAEQVPQRTRRSRKQSEPMAETRDEEREAKFRKAAEEHASNKSAARQSAAPPEQSAPVDGHGRAHMHKENRSKVSEGSFAAGPEGVATEDSQQAAPEAASPSAPQDEGNGTDAAAAAQRPRRMQLQERIIAKIAALLKKLSRNERWIVVSKQLAQWQRLALERHLLPGTRDSEAATGRETDLALCEGLSEESESNSSADSDEEQLATLQPAKAAAVLALCDAAAGPAMQDGHVAESADLARQLDQEYAMQQPSPDDIEALPETAAVAGTQSHNESLHASPDVAPPQEDPASLVKPGRTAKSFGCNIQGIASHMRRRGVVTYYANVTIGMLRMVSRESSDLARVLDVHVAFLNARRRVRQAVSLPFELAFREGLAEAFREAGLELIDMSMCLIIPASYWIGTDLSTTFFRGDQLDACLDSWRRLKTARGEIFNGGNVLFFQSPAELDQTWSKLAFCT